MYKNTKDHAYDKCMEIYNFYMNSHLDVNHLHAHECCKFIDVDINYLTNEELDNIVLKCDIPSFEDIITQIGLNSTYVIVPYYENSEMQMMYNSLDDSFYKIHNIPTIPICLIVLNMLEHCRFINYFTKQITLILSHKSTMLRNFINKELSKINPNKIMHEHAVRDVPL